MTKLYDEVLEIIQDEGNEEEQKLYMEDVMNHGCISGIVGELITYYDTINFYKRHMDEIDEMLDEIEESFGMDASELLNKDLFEFEYNDFTESSQLNFDSETTQNGLAWFAFEEMTRRIYEENYGAY